MKERDRRNLDPHKPAVVAISFWGKVYAAQGGGAMDFWDNLSEPDKRFCREIVAHVERARPEVPQS